MRTRTASLATAIVTHVLFAVALHAQAPVEKVHLVITGGKNAGTHDATGTRAGCSANATGPGSFGNQLSDPKGPPGKFNSLQLVIPNAKAAAAGTSEFQLIVGFGPLMKRTAEYEVNTTATGKKKGSGTVKLSDGGTKAEVKIDATTADGVKISGTISCLTVTRL